MHSASMQPDSACSNQHCQRKMHDSEITATAAVTAINHKASFRQTAYVFEDLIVQLQPDILSFLQGGFECHQPLGVQGHVISMLSTSWISSSCLQRQQVLNAPLCHAFASKTNIRHKRLAFCNFTSVCCSQTTYEKRITVSQSNKSTQLGSLWLQVDGLHWPSADLDRTVMFSDVRHTQCKAAMALVTSAATA